MKRFGRDDQPSRLGRDTRGLTGSAWPKSIADYERAKAALRRASTKPNADAD